MAKLETKFDLGQTVFFVSQDRIRSGVIGAININITSLGVEYKYDLSVFKGTNSNLFLTKEDVLKWLSEDLYNPIPPLNSLNNG